MTTDFRKRTRQLALSYLAIIMALSLLFSGVVYAVVATQLDRPLPPRKYADQSIQDIPEEFRTRIDERDRQTRQSTIASLAILNVVMLAGGARLSFYLARRTLQPIKQAMDAQNQFIGDASHELRTPLTALQTTNQVALRKKHIDDAKAREVLRKNISEVSKLHNLTESLLSLVHAEQRAVMAEAIWLDELARDVAMSLSSVADIKQITIDVTVDHRILSTDAAILAQVLTILTDNAIKYSPEGSTVTIGSKTENGSTTLFVRDQGIGISSDDQAHIFDRFYRADTARTRTDTSGHGLGLAIARTQVERLRGSLTVKSAPDQGSTFYLQFAKQHSDHKPL